MSPALFVVLRHGFSLAQDAKRGARWLPDGAAKKKLAGLTDRTVPLTLHGVIQARKAGRAIRERFGVFDATYVSTYRRAQETLREVLGAYPPDLKRKMPVFVTPLLDERDCGHTFDLTAEEVAEKYPDLEAYWAARGEFRACFPGGENMAGVCERARRFRSELRKMWRGKRVLAVCHWGSIMGLRNVLEGWTEDETLSAMGLEHPENCSLTVYRSNAEGKLVLSEKNVQLCECP